MTCHKTQFVPIISREFRPVMPLPWWQCCIFIAASSFLSWMFLIGTIVLFGPSIINWIAGG